jgi:hypothetical protein
MKLVPLCTMTSRRIDHAYTDALPGGERVGWVVGEGRVEGERLSGTLRRSNVPHHRADGVNVDTTNGVITTPDGASVFYELRGLAVVTAGGAPARDILASVTFRTSAPAYAWLNSVFAVAEAKYDGLGGPSEYHIFECRPGAA